MDDNSLNTPARRDLTLQLLIGAAIASAFASGISLEVFGITVTASYMVTAMLVGYLMLYAAFTRRRVPLVFRDDFSLLLYLFVLSNVFTSLLFSAQRFYSLKGCAPLIACLLLYSAVRGGIRLLGEDAAWAVLWTKKSNLVSAAFGLFCMVMAMVTGRENLGVSFGHLAIGMSTLGELVPPSIRSLAVEPNLFAICTASVLCLSIGKYLMGDHAEKKRWWIAVPALAIFFAYTRSVYGALVIVMFVLMVLARKTKVIYRVAIAAVLATTMFSAVFLALPQENPARKAIAERFGTIVDFRGGTGEGRLLGYQLAWKSYLHRPILGNGTLSADTRAYNPYTGVFQDRMGAPGWLTGSGIQALHDTGIVGLLILFSLFGLIMWRNLVAFRKLTEGDSRRGLLLGFLGGNMILFIASQLSSPLWIAFPYVFWAVNMEFLNHCRQTQESRA